MQDTSEVRAGIQQPQVSYAVKRCNKCREVKPLTEFSNRKKARDGRQPRCKSCNAEYAAENKVAIGAKRKAYYEAHKADLLAKQKAYREAHADKIAASGAAYYVAHREEIREYKKSYYEANREAEIARTSRHYEANKDRKAEYNAAYREAHREQLAAYKAAYYLDNRDKLLQYAKAHQNANMASIARKAAEYRAANRDRLAAMDAAWRRANRHIRNALNARRRAAKLQATPAWADKDAIAVFYAESDARTKATGIPHNVDHIVPLQSPIVCGLHCEANLEVLTEKSNLEKSNRWWPDMP